MFQGDTSLCEGNSAAQLLNVAYCQSHFAQNVQLGTDNLHLVTGPIPAARLV